jgi:hypothetical protein
LQVKSASKTHGIGLRYKFYTAKKSGMRSDVYAFVAVDLDAVVFRRGDEILKTATYVSEAEFLNESMSMQKTLGSFK